MTEPVVVFVKMSQAGAQRPDGQRIRAVVELGSPPQAYVGGVVGYECTGGSDEVSRCVDFRSGLEVDEAADRIVVEGVLRVIRHSSATRNGVAFAGFVEYLLGDAVVGGRRDVQQ